MNISSLLKAAFGATVLALMIANPVCAETFNIPSGDLGAALDSYTKQTGVPVIIAGETLKGAHTSGVHGDYSVESALTRILDGTGFDIRHRPSGAVVIVRGDTSTEELLPRQLAAASVPTASGAALETVTVTSSKIGGDVQNIPIAITALSQEQLTATQTAGGPDLIKQVPNMTFTKTNFSGYSINIRGIGTQAISVTTDPAVAVAFNDMPFIRNHFFEQEFYDVASVEVARGPQGTLYGRNATAGVVNLASAKPTDQFEAMASADIGNYQNRRFEGMLNVPIVDDRLDIRIAGEWTKRQGYSFDSLTDNRIDGRDLWSGRLTIGWKPAANVQTYLIWEHFSEDDDRMRTAKQLCKTDPSPSEVDGAPTNTSSAENVYDPARYLSQGCSPSSLYSADAFEVPNGKTLAYYGSLWYLGAPIHSLAVVDIFDPYASTTQSRNLRVIESALTPSYKAKNDIVELNTDYKIRPGLTFTSQTGFNHDFLWSFEDYNRFNTAPGAFVYRPNSGLPLSPDPNGNGTCEQTSGGCVVNAPCKPLVNNESNACVLNGIFCDPQLGCSDRLVAGDLSDEHAWQFSQEFRLASDFGGPFNFSVGGNYLHYETEENYYVFVNTIASTSAVCTNPTAPPQDCIISNNLDSLPGGAVNSNPNIPQNPFDARYVDNHPITSLDNEGHTYFLSQNPYALNSYAAFGEAYYNVTSDLKLISGLRWTEDQKHFTDIPSELLIPGYGYPVTGVVNQQWDQFTGRATANWSPKLDFTNQTLLYVSYSHGYKAGGANPPGAILLVFGQGNGQVGNPIHPLTFKPEFVDAFELGSKNTLLDGSLTFNVDAFYYNYENYQISEIVDRTSINLNFDTHVKGAEIESSYEPIPGLRFNFAGGWEDTALAKGSKAVDLIDRTAGTPGWMVVKPFVTQASNCILPVDAVLGLLALGSNNIAFACGEAYSSHADPVTEAGYVPNPAGYFIFPNGVPTQYPGFDPLTAPNNGQGFDKNLSGNKLPNAPPFTVSVGAQYTIPLTPDWAGTLRGDYYWQDYSWARVFNDNPYDRLRGYTSLNLTLIFTNQNGWQVMLYDKNVFNETAITGTFLNSDDSSLTTNVFLTDPKLIGIRVTKNW